MNLGKKEAIICLAAGKSQLPIILKAKEMGFFVISIDQNIDSIGFTYSDYKIIESTHNFQTIISELRKLESKFKFKGVLNRSAGPPVRVAAIISETFNIQGYSFETANTIINKNLLRNFCINSKIKTPKFEIFSKGEIISTQLNFPLVIKPALSLIGKKGVSVIRNYENLSFAIDYAFQYTINDKILIEEFIDGEDISLVSFVNNSEIFPVCVLDELNVEISSSEISGFGFKTHNIYDGSLIKLVEISQFIVNELKISRSPFISCFRKTILGDFYLIEIHLDLGGDRLIEEFYPSALNIDFVKLAIDMSVGNVEDIDIKINPTAIIFDNLNKHLNERKINIIKAKSYKQLEKKILK